MDKTVLGDLDSLPEDDKIRMSAIIDRLQSRDRSDATPPSPHLHHFLKVNEALRCASFLLAVAPFPSYLKDFEMFELVDLLSMRF